MRLLRRYLLAFVGIMALSPLSLLGQICPSATITSARAQSGTNFSLPEIIAQFKNPSSDLVLLTAHRGYWEYCPENTIEAFQSSIDQGLEDVEMDIRVSAPGNDANGTNYSNGEAYLTHDYDLRGEAPGVVGQQGNNLGYTLTPAQLQARSMVDRYGNPAMDSAGNPIVMHTLTDLLFSYYRRALLQPGAIQSTGGTVCNMTVNKAPMVVRGAMITFDIKGGDPVGGATVPGMQSQYNTFLEVVSEISQFECQYKIDLSYAVSFKVALKNLPAESSTFRAAVRTANPWGYLMPNLIAVIYGSNLPNAAFSATLADYRANYPAYLLGDWQVNYPGGNLDEAVASEHASGFGVMGFQPYPSYPEGLRNSDGTCKQYRTNLPPNASVCVSHPLISSNPSSIEFLVPPASLGQQGVSAITTDNIANAITYLKSIDMRNLAHIQ